MGREVLTLPFAVQVALGSGYLAYLLAYSGIRQHHNATDVLFRTLAFGLAASVIIYFAPHSWVAIAVAFAAPLLLAALWRWRGITATKSVLRNTEISWSDDIPTAWLSIVAETARARPAQIAVDLDNGRTLTCDDTRLFADAPHGPCLFGLDGSIGMYVTAERRENGEWVEHTDVRNPVDGDRLTYIPAASVRRVEIRLWTKANEKASKAVEQLPAAVVEPEAEGAARSPESAPEDATS
jgi:hypothetical protein